jgi:transcriptional regulator with PAS, ATPase and Fis domain
MKTTVEASPLRPTQTSRPALRVLFSGSAGIVSRPPYYLGEGPNPIGRTLSGSGILLADDEQVSRLHATVFLEKGALRIADSGSRNGTAVNGQRIEVGPLSDGDILRIGNSFLIVRSEATATEGGPDSPIEGLLGRAPAMRKLRSALRLVAKEPAMVLLFGESGAGKEVVARAIHQLSGRSGPFVAINCSAIPEALAESQLFGHTRGAFTGATQHAGYFRAAHGGTLFLDEVGELPGPVQPKLLRALEEKSVLPVGATQALPCDVRIVAATNRDLTAAIETGSFRGDLFARLAEFTLSLPSLRERREDILLLAQRALGEGAAPQLHPDLVERLLLHGWPYNVRELFKVLTELRIRAAGASPLLLEHLEGRLQPAPPRPSGSPPAPPSPALGDKEAEAGRGAEKSRAPIPTREELGELMRKHRNVIADVAREVGRSRAQVYRWLKQLELARDGDDKDDDKSDDKCDDKGDD